MATLTLKKNEFTVSTLIDKMKKEYGTKSNGAPFVAADIHDWANRGRVPKQYGGQYVYFAKLGPLKVLRLSDNANEQIDQQIEIVQI